MVSKQQKKQSLQCLEYVCHRLEESGLYHIQKRNHLSVDALEKAGEGEKSPRTIRVMIPNFVKTIDLFEQGCQACREKGIYLAPVFYKDGETAFVRMVEKNPSWRSDKSLKRYSLQKINRMLHLRGREKAVAELFDSKLAYYQPETVGLAESLRTFELRPVEFDYSHIRYGDQAYGFAEDRPSIDYKLPEETESITGAAKFVFASQQPDFYRRARLAGIK